MTSGLVRIWRDCGYTEGALEVPSKTSSLSTPEYVFDIPSVPRDQMFSAFTVKAPYTDLYDCSYVEVTYNIQAADSFTVYGWIDRVTVMSDTKDSPSTRVDWHLDYWRTYLSKAKFGAGMVKRRPATTDIPPQSYPYRYYTNGSSKTLIPNNSIWWIIVNLSANVDASVAENATGGTVLAWPVDITSDTSYKLSTSSGTYSTPGRWALIRGTWDELLGLDPTAIKSVFLSPVAPSSYTVDTTTRTVVMANKYVTYHVYSLPDLTPTITTAAAVLADTKAIDKYSSAVTSTVTSDTSVWMISGFDGEPIGSLPWGISVDSYDYRCVIDSSSAYIQIRFGESILSNALGLTFTIPLIPVEVTSNAWSSYVYSGARQADIDQRRANTDKAVESAMINAPSKIASGVSSGDPLKAVSSVVSSVTDIASAQYLGDKYNAIFQDIADYRKANQTPGLIMSGTGFDVFRNGFTGILLRELKIDDYAYTQRAADMRLYGAHVSEPMADCSSLISAGGPLVITNLNVTGDMPVEAKDYFRKRFETGVRII